MYYGFMLGKKKANFSHRKFVPRVPEFLLISSKHEEKEIYLSIIVPLYICISLIINKERNYLTGELNSGV